MTDALEPATATESTTTESITAESTTESEYARTEYDWIRKNRIQGKLTTPR